MLGNNLEIFKEYVIIKAKNPIAANAIKRLKNLIETNTSVKTFESPFGVPLKNRP